MNTRHSFQAGHATEGFRPRFPREFRAAPAATNADVHEAEHLNRPTWRLPFGRPGLRALLDAWDRLAGPISEAQLRDGLRNLRIDRQALWNCVRFDDRTPQRTRIRRRENYEVLIDCWMSGQMSPIHDYGDSTSAVLVVEGAATQIGFMATSSGLLAPSRSQRAETGAVIVTRPRETHQIGNLEAAGVELVSLQVFSPPPSGDRRRRLAETSFAHHDALVDEEPEVGWASI